jgi:hypothetical protein
MWVGTVKFLMNVNGAAIFVTDCRGRHWKYITLSQIFNKNFCFVKQKTCILALQRG